MPRTPRADQVRREARLRREGRLHQEAPSVRGFRANCRYERCASSSSCNHSVVTSTGHASAMDWMAHQPTFSGSVLTGRDNSSPDAERRRRSRPDYPRMVCDTRIAPVEKKSIVLNRPHLESAPTRRRWSHHVAVAKCSLRSVRHEQRGDPDVCPSRCRLPHANDDALSPLWADLWCMADRSSLRELPVHRPVSI